MFLWRRFEDTTGYTFGGMDIAALDIQKSSINARHISGRERTRRNKIYGRISEI